MRYCSIPCRRLAEAERRRVARRLEQLENMLVHTRLSGDGIGFGNQTTEERCAALQVEIERATARLRELFEDAE